MNKVITSPTILGRNLDNARAEFELQIPADLLYFMGHFPNAPILPGVVQVHWAVKFSNQSFSLTHEVPKIMQVKFQKVILPKALVTLVLKFDTEKQWVVFGYHSNLGDHSSGQLKFGVS